MTGPLVDIVVPTVGRSSLGCLLEALAVQTVPPPPVLLVDDRPAAPFQSDRPPLGPFPGTMAVDVRTSGGRGPAAARNTGWQAGSAPWVVFLDDDVLPPSDWFATLLDDLAWLAPDVAASQGRIRVPLPTGRRPTDWERNVAGLETARWATADMAYRRDAVEAVGGFDERFPRAYREDADLGLRVTRAGWRIVTGRRMIDHPVRPADRWVSVRLQRGNADDALMRALHGPRWREAAGAGTGRLRRHAALTTAGAVAVAAGSAAIVSAVANRRSTRSIASKATSIAVAGAGGWLAGTAEFASARLAPGPRTADELFTVVATSAAIPPAAVWHRLAGTIRARHLARNPGYVRRPPGGNGPGPVRPKALPAAVLFDRDGTLVRDVPYNGDPDRVDAMPGARRALDRLRAAGVRLAVVSNQSGVGRGRLSVAEVEAVNRRIEEVLGPVGPWLVCLHAPEDGCGCRKPAPGLILQAADLLGVDPSRCAVVGDIGADVEAALAAGARAVLVPTDRTRRDEIDRAPEVAPDLESAVTLLLGSGR